MTVVKTKTQTSFHTLESHFVDPKVGLVQGLQIRFPYPGEPPIFTAVARLSYDAHDFNLARFLVGGSGMSADVSLAQISAVCESVERYCLHADKADVITGSYAHISQQFAALDPDTCPLFHPEQYPEVGYEPFTPNTQLAWSWAISLPQGEPTLVPTRFIYLEYPPQEDDAYIMRTISTGAACGRSAADAAVRGIYEIVERDAMMIMWLNRHPCPRLVVDSQTGLGQFIQRYLQLPGLTHHLFLTTNDLAIPACMAILMDGPPGAQRVFVGLAANLDPEKAAMNALIEAFEVYQALADPQEEQPVVAAPEDITSIHRHALYYVQQDRTHLLDFLLNSPHTVCLDAVPNKATGKPQTDLNVCLELCAQAGLRVFAADVTKDDIRPTGLRVVRVIMPEMQRLTASHNKPFLGNPRLYSVPVKLGWRAEPLSPDAVNPNPHPFV